MSTNDRAPGQATTMPQAGTTTTPTGSRSSAQLGRIRRTPSPAGEAGRTTGSYRSGLNPGPDGPVPGPVRASVRDGRWRGRPLHDRARGTTGRTADERVRSAPVLGRGGSRLAPPRPDGPVPLRRHVPRRVG